MLGWLGIRTSPPRVVRQDLLRVELFHEALDELVVARASARSCLGGVVGAPARARAAAPAPVTARIARDDQLAVGGVLGLALGQRRPSRPTRASAPRRRAPTGARLEERRQQRPLRLERSSTAGHSSAKASRSSAHRGDHRLLARRLDDRDGGDRRLRVGRRRRGGRGGRPEAAGGERRPAAAPRRARPGGGLFGAPFVGAARPAAVAGTSGAAPARRRAASAPDGRASRRSRRDRQRLRATGRRSGAAALTSASSSWVRASAPSFIARRPTAMQVEQADDVGRADAARPARRRRSSCSAVTAISGGTSPQRLHDHQRARVGLEVAEEAADVAAGLGQPGGGEQRGARRRRRRPRRRRRTAGRRRRRRARRARRSSSIVAPE